MEKDETVYSVEADHPALPGHFPGNPVVPGVVILDAVANALSQWQPDASVSRIKSAKFVSPLLPGESMHIALELKGETAAAFKCRVAERTVAQGSFALERHEPGLV